MSEIRLQTLNRNILDSGKTCGLGLHLVIICGSRSMHLQKVDSGSIDPGLLHCIAHGEKQPVTGPGRP